MLFCKPCPTQWGWQLPYFLHLKLQCSNLFNQLTKKQIDLCSYSALCWQPPTKASSKKEGREQTGGGLSGWEWAPARAFRGWPTVTSLRAVFRILFLWSDSSIRNNWWTFLIENLLHVRTGNCFTVWNVQTFSDWLTASMSWCTVCQLMWRLTVNKRVSHSHCK